MLTTEVLVAEKPKNKEEPAHGGGGGGMGGMGDDY
jgi:chaperonin GroEL